MASKYITENISSVIREKSRPGITWWNRLEGRPRADKFERALRAEVRDPLWMLTRQWQMGEFQGDDAGSPIMAKIHVEATRLQKFQPADGPVRAIDESIPLEAQVERLPVPFSQKQKIHGTLSDLDTSLDIRLLMGRQWLKMIGPISAAAIPQFIDTYPVHAPDPTLPEDFAICAHPEAWSNFQAAATRLMDGWKLYFHLTQSSTNHASDGIAALAGMDATVDPVAGRFVGWFQKLFYQPDPPPDVSSWIADRLEYRFAASAPLKQGEKVFVAEEYYHGHLDWFNFDIDPQRDALDAPDPAAEAPKPVVLTMLPTQVTFNGMPNTRWWRFEDGRTNFGDVKPDTTDLAKLLLIEFGLVYANDWFLVPFTVPAGSISTIRGAAVTNVFGERIWVEAAGRGDDDDWQRWAMFLISLKGKGHEPADLSLLIPPVAQQVLDGQPLDDVMLARDEMSNMVWGLERNIQLPSGERKNGREAAYEVRSFYERDVERRLGAPPAPLPGAADARIRYRVMTSVPEQWIPMIPVHVDGDNRETQLQRAAMPRFLEGDTFAPDAVPPRTYLLRQGLDEQPAVKYLLHEEEVPRAGSRATRAFQRTRWRDGRVWVWLGVRKQTGRGEGSSGLAFDQIVDLPSGP
ncbi:MAG TPA: hypothetical protein VFT47_08625 [Vicinamibacterales bacterium]|nr:hypothetical protein [Vicinamibacterales bacterium]